MTTDAPAGLIDTMRSWFAANPKPNAPEPGIPAPQAPQAQVAAPPPPNPPTTPIAASPSERPRDEQGRFLAASQANAPSADPTPAVMFTQEQVAALLRFAQSNNQQTTPPPAPAIAPTLASSATPPADPYGQWGAHNIHEAPLEIAQKWFAEGGFERAIANGEVRF